MQKNNARLLRVIKTLYERCHKNKLIGLIVFGIGTASALALEILYRYYRWLDWSGNLSNNFSLVAGGLGIVFWIAQFLFFGHLQWQKNHSQTYFYLLYDSYHDHWVHMVTTLSHI